MKYILLLSALLSFDIATKQFAQYFLSQKIILIPNILSLEYYENIGIAFSLPLTGLLLKILTAVLIFSIFWYYWKYERSQKNLVLTLSYILIFAGAIGNGWERIFQNYVIDFIAVEHLFICNVADIYISLGAIGLIWYHTRRTSLTS